MGRMSITFEELENYLRYEENNYSEEQKFLDDFYNIGFTKKSNEVLDLNIDRYPQINFSYDDLEGLDKTKLYNNYKNFLKRDEQIDDTLFYIAENYYEVFFQFQSEYINQFELIKSTYAKNPDFAELIKKLDTKIIHFQDLLYRIKNSPDHNKLVQRDLSASIQNINLNKNNYNLINDISNDIKQFEEGNFYYFERDKEETIDYFNNAINTLKEIKYKITGSSDFYEESEEKSYLMNESIDYKNQDMNFFISEKMSAPSRLDSSEDFPEIASIEDFDELSLRVFDEIGIKIKSDIYINFLALLRMKEHLDDINDLKNNIGTILKN